jgi:hypothetical protein
VWLAAWWCSLESSDTGWRRRFWLTRDYLTKVAELLVGGPSLAELARAIGARVEPVLVPWDCADGFFEAYWRRPEAYLDDQVRRGISVWTRVGSGLATVPAVTAPLGLVGGEMPVRYLYGPELVWLSSWPTEIAGADAVT